MANSSEDDYGFSSEYGSEPDYASFNEYDSEPEFESEEDETGSDIANEEEDDDKISISDESENADCTETLISQSQTLDRFSSLPDNILAKIFSDTTVDHVLQLSQLSKRFKNLWKSLTTVRFIDNERRGNEEYFVRSVNATLTCYNCKFHQVIDKLVFNFHYEDEYESSVNRWIWFAVRKNVEDLVLCFSISSLSEPDNCDLFRFSEFFFDNPSLRKLTTSFCNYSPRGGINWSSLQCLAISYTKELDDDVFDKILSGCPVLESLSISYWTNLSHLDIYSKSLKSFALNDEWYSAYDPDKTLDDLVISGPYLQSLQVSGLLMRINFELGNLDSLVDATINMAVFTLSDEDCRGGNGMYELSTSSRRDMLMDILEELCHVKELKLGKWCLEILSTFDCGTMALPSSLSKCKSLVLDARFKKEVINGLSVLFNVSPQVENLTLRVSKGCSLVDWDSMCNRTTDYNILWMKFFKHLLPTLKVVEVRGFCPKDESMEHVTSLIKFLLSNGTVLEKMIIDASREGESYLESMPRESLELAQKLLCLHRASPHVLVQLK